MKHILTVLAFLFAHYTAHLQSTYQYLDINNIKARINARGMLFVNPTNNSPAYEFPKSSSKHSAQATGIWISATDSNNNQVYVAASGAALPGDFFTGPLSDSATISANEMTNWNRVWKVSASDISVFLNTTPHTINNTPIDILEWPGRGNPYFANNSSSYLTASPAAPFVDVNNDNVYNAIEGDYPLLSGEQMTWQVYNDMGGAKTYSGSQGMGLQIEQTSFACTGQPFNNVTFHNFKLINKSPRSYNLSRVGLFTVNHLGSASDDYVGFSQPNRCAIVYNGDGFDDGAYGSTLTQSGYMLLKQPSELDTLYTPGAMLSFKNDNSNFGNPASPQHFYSYMRAMWKDSTHLKEVCDQSTATASSADIDFIFKDDPSNNSGFSERTCVNQAGDRNIVFSSNDFTWYPGQVVYYTIAIMNTGLGSDNSNFYAISALADSVYNYFPACVQFANALQTNNINPNNNIRIFPNPGKDFVRIDNSTKTSYDLTVIDASGKLIFSSQQIKDESYLLQTNNWSKGMYFVHIKSTSGYITQKLLLE